ncbi:DDE-type integrase/transposase/recombinase [Leifsonia shinshuensis]|uniref:integrase core domain-containing protein n=1 Tax=Leifsonia shinshuensis TaxID=150026 RepID=UPI0029F1F5AB|nr:DDE-type integrase/transposase/recombinase [Leifsonia shinshuensis]
MSRVEPVDPRVRLAITQWPPDAPRGSVTTFCAEHGISRKTFYEIRKRAIEDGPAAALEPRSRRPRASPGKITEEIKQQAIQVRAALEQSGLDHGPISVHDRMQLLRITPVPAVSSLARIFRDAGVARLEPRKRPRASYRRFVYPAPNACWQIDATEYVLTEGRKCVIFQLIDDHSRLAVASHVAWTESSQDAITVVAKAIRIHGVPQRLLSDNGMALNPSRRGFAGQLTTYLASYGVEAITGKPFKPTTQGKNERFHQTLFRYLDKQPIAATLAQLQEQVDAFDIIYNTQRPHQALPGRITPHQAWQATPKAESPRPPAHDSRLGRRDEGIRVKLVDRGGSVEFHGIRFGISRDYSKKRIAILDTGPTIMFFDLDGTLIIEQPWPSPGVKYVSNGRPRGRRPAPKPDELSPMS